MAPNLIVDDDYIEKQVNHIKNGLMKMDTVIDLYIKCLNQMSQDVIQDGATAMALEIYISYAKQLQGDLKEIGDNTSSLLNNYLLAIDHADQYLF